MEFPLELIALVGIILALVGRTLIPYLKKVNEDPDISFDFGYVGTMIFAGVVSSIFIFPLFVFPESATPWTVFIAAFIFSWSANDVTNRLVK